MKSKFDEKKILGNSKYTFPKWLKFKIGLNFILGLTGNERKTLYAINMSLLVTRYQIELKSNVILDIRKPMKKYLQTWITGVNQTLSTPFRVSIEVNINRNKPVNRWKERRKRESSGM